MAGIKKFSPKDPVERVLVTFDFANQFVDQAEEITSADWAVHTAFGVDASPSLMLHGTASFDATSTSRLIKGGNEGCIYHIEALISTSKNQVLKMVGALAIETKQ